MFLKEGEILPREASSSNRPSSPPYEQSLRNFLLSISSKLMSHNIFNYIYIYVYKQCGVAPHRAKSNERKLRIDKHWHNQLRKILLIDPLSTNSAIYRNSLTITSMFSPYFSFSWKVHTEILLFLYLSQVFRGATFVKSVFNLEWRMVALHNFFVKNVCC